MGLGIGVDDEKYEVGEYNRGEYFIHMLLRDRESGFKWNLIVVYGAAHDKDKEVFLIELPKF